MTDKPALTYPVPVLNLPQKGLTVNIGTSEKERAALAAEHGLEAVNSFDAELLLTRWKKNGIRLRGHINAQIVQSCVVTLEPVGSKIAEEIDAVFVPENSRLARIQLDESGELLLDAEDADIPETFTGDKIDLGAIVEEFFELAIDPYPRTLGLAPETEPMVYGGGEEEENKPDSPFAKLSEWRNKP
ncbi:DUF177 domain-containing protein [Falsochrobactrum sp. TDYN1]|uniref:DUF177 domain-containing protein n=1 Tax=Falsochrobactrum tianjinense TaxID=2706015 RepID=A0A949UTX2_9HYPH|nr:DUF177 domain-containing protein [Falsochrobactrum sp. TDYN1]MBV2142786.1 DUF177 domain-containing protein [Falsochrobactrum sp. TDYN1]